MPRGRGRGGGASPSPLRRQAPSPPASPPRPPAPKWAQPALPAPPASKFGGLGSAIAGTFIGSALGSVLGNAISSRMYEGRDPSSGQWLDNNKVDSNPCKKELDYFLQCARFSFDQSYCKGAAEDLKRCAELHKDYFEGK